MIEESTQRNEAEPAVPPEIGANEADPAAASVAPISTLYDLSLLVTVELGRTRMSVQDVLSLARGSVIELDRLVGEPIDVYAGDRRFAEGEVVVIGEQFGIRITRVIDRSGPELQAES